MLKRQSWWMAAWIISAGAGVFVGCGSTKSNLEGDLFTDPGTSDPSVETVEQGAPEPAFLEDGGVLPGGGGTLPDGSVADAGPPAAPLNSFCQTQALMAVRCATAGCHTAGSAFGPLVTADDLLLPSKSNPASNMAAVSLQRMKDNARPMPPSPGVRATPAELATLEGWINGGAVKTCTTPIDSGVPAENFNTPLTCTSNVVWTNRNNINMRPGSACIACHNTKTDELFSLAGTVYPTAHERENCYTKLAGYADIRVVVTDSLGVRVTMSLGGGTAGAGNFTSTARLTPPLLTKVVNLATGRERLMVSKFNSGDCNTCHNETGINGAPGRIVAPL